MSRLNPVPARASEVAISPQLKVFCPDLGEWPLRWRADDGDITFGQALVETFTPFLIAVLAADVSPKTRARRRDHLWMLGGELVRRLYDEPKLRQWSAIAVVRHYIDDEGGPLIYPYITEAQQRSFDVTCRKLYRFLGEAQEAE